MPEPEPNQQQAERLTLEAYDALDAGESERALELAERLHEMGFSSCFAIFAVAYREQGQPELALEALQDATENVPDVGILWQLLGETLLDLKRPEDALEAFDRALEFDELDPLELRLNRATALWLAKRFDEALQEIAATDATLDQASISLRWRLEAVRVILWSELDRCAEVEARAAQLWDAQLDLEIEEDEVAPLAVAFSHLGWALLYCGQNERALRWARAALEIDTNNAQAQLLARQAQNITP